MSEIVALVIGIVGPFSMQAPLDVVIAAAISAYHGSHNRRPDCGFDLFT